MRKLLDLIESRAVQAVTTQVRNAQPVRGQGKGSGKVNSKGKGKSAVEKDNGRNIEEEVKLLGKTKKEEVVFLKGMGKAIDKTLQLGLYFQGQKDLKIRVKTGTVEVVDDVVEGEKDGEGDVDKEKEGEKVGDKAVGDKMDVDEEEVPDTQVRMTSMVEIAVGFR